MTVGVRPLVGALLVALFAASATTPASAQPSLPVYSWTGWYAGANVGYASGRSDIASLFTCPNPGACAYDARDSAPTSALGTGPLSDRGFTGGMQAGYNWQAGLIVLGVEADINALKLRQSRTVRATPVGEAADNFWLTTGFEASSVITVRGRLGVTITPTALLYATGGLARTTLKVSNRFVDDASTIPGVTVNTFGESSVSQAKFGWTAGGGAEWGLTGNWTLKAEYLYLDFGSITTTARVVNTDVAPDDPNLLTTVANLKAHIARIGLNFRF